MENSLNCELCNTKPYDTTATVEVNGESDTLLVCFTCKDAILTERNKDNVFDLEDENSETIEQGVEDALANDTPNKDFGVRDNGRIIYHEENESEYTTEMADRFGVGGRY